jgi:hypothetical protein
MHNVTELLLDVFKLVLLACILSVLIHIYGAINDKGINMHLYQQVTTEHCSWDVKTSKGTVINMKGGD